MSSTDDNERKEIVEVDVEQLQDDVEKLRKLMNDREEMVQVEFEQLRANAEKSRKLVSTLLTIIMEEADGIQSGAAPQIPNQPRKGYCM